MTIERNATTSSISDALRIPANYVIGKPVTVRDRLLGDAFSACERKLLELWFTEMPRAPRGRNQIQFNKANFTIAAGSTL